MITTLIFDFLGVLQPLGSSDLAMDPLLLDYIGKVKKRFQLVLFTSSNLEAMPALRQELHPYFSQIFTTKMIGSSKRDPESYIRLVETLHILPAQGLFIDDQVENISAAVRAGLQAIHHEETGQTLEKIQALCSAKEL